MIIDRADAGRCLARKLERFSGARDALVVAIPNGGVMVAEPIARALRLPLEALICRKVRCASDHALPAGALSETGVHHLNRLPGPERISAQKLREQLGWTRRRIDQDLALLRPEGSFFAVSERHVILVDDGIVTGATIMAAVKALRALKPARLTVAVPVGPSEVLSELAALVDACEILQVSELGRLGDHYRDWPTVPIDEALEALKAARAAT